MPDEKLVDPASIPIYFADRIVSVANSDDTVKMYLARSDPGVDGLVSATTTVSAQVVMPMRTFIETLAFFTSVFKSMKEQGVATQKQLDEAINLQEQSDEE